MSGLDLRRLVGPESIAVVGATDRPGSYAGQVLLNLETIGFAGEVWGVNPGRSSVFGHPCVPSVSELPTAVDAVVVAIPAPGVPDVVDAAGARGCGGAVVLSAGFAEVPGGAELEAALVAAAERFALPVCGPNCNGIVAMHARCALWGDVLAPREPGHVALVSQSGNLAVNALAARRGLRFHTVITTGNQAMLGPDDFLTFLADEPEVRAIALYLEDDGGPGLCEGLAACADAGVRVVVLKAGSSHAGARAASAHSASLAGDQRVFRSLVEEAGGLWASDLHELLELAKAAAVESKPAGRGGLAIMTCSGGDSAVGADMAEQLGLELPPVGPDTAARLRELLPPAATVANPLDYTTMIWGDAAALGELVRAVGEDPAIGQLLVFYDQPAELDPAGVQSWAAVREGLIAGAAASPVRTIVSATLPELLDDAAAWRFAQAGIPAAAGMRAGLRCAAALGAPLADAVRLRSIGAAARAASRPGRAASAVDWLAEHAAKELLRAGGVAVVEGRVVADEDDAAVAFSELGSPLVLKVTAAAIQHKSELGAVLTGLDSEPSVRTAYRRLDALAAAHGGTVLAERTAPPGVEVVVAAHTDGVVPALVVGLGGIWTEVFDDVQIVPLPADAARIEKAMRSLRGASLLLGGRGGVAVDVGAVARLAERVGELLLTESLELIELNPVFAGPDGAVAVDATARRTVRVLSA
jgi:acetyl-CoA synthetase